MNCHSLVMTMQVSNENSLIDDVIRRIRSGDTVEFEIAAGRKGPEAVDVKVV